MLNFLMLVHNHQPLGNFDYVMENSFQKAYKPFIDVLSEFEIKLSLHISGSLFDWLTLHHLEYIETIKSLVKTGRIEIVGSGYYEPILAAIPEEDAINQLSIYKSCLEKTFETDVIGSWLTERVWEPHLPKIFKKGGIDYIVTDDYHFIRSGFSYNDLGGYYLTDYDNHTLAIYPGSEMLRYIMPFSTIDKIYDFFKDSYDKGINTLVFADDGEKFGVWPETYNWVYQEKWLKNFFKFLVENRDWINTLTIKEHFSSFEPKGCCYLPTTSYPELGEWALPTNASITYKKTLDMFKSYPNYIEIKPFFQGGQWKNFLAKYREGRILYRKMHYVSELLRNKPIKLKTDLFKAQCNDAYWHGIFGGLYLPHLRREINSNIVSAMKTGLKKNCVDLYDFDLDGSEEILVKNEELALILSPNDGATILSIDFLEKNLTLTDTLTRRKEPYHFKIKDAQNETTGTKTIHEQFKTKEEGLDNFLRYDTYEKTSFRCHLFKSFPKDITSELSHPAHNVAISKHGWDRKKLKGGEQFYFTKESEGLFCEKSITVMGNVIQTSVNIKAEEDYKYVAIEWNFNLFAPDTDDRYVLINSSTKKPINYVGDYQDINTLSLVDEWYGIRIDFNLSGFKNIYTFPIYTVSLSESGLEKTFQGTTLIFLGPLINGIFSGKTNIIIESLPR